MALIKDGVCVCVRIIKHYYYVTLFSWCKSFAHVNFMSVGCIHIVNY